MTTEELKQQMVAHLKMRSNYDISMLWGESKYWAKKKGYEMGGSYSSVGDHISVHLIVNKNHHRFNITLEEIK